MIIDNCRLQIDERCGVIYVHGPDGTVLRICGLPPLSERSAFLDVTVRECIVSDVPYESTMTYAERYVPDMPYED